MDVHNLFIHAFVVNTEARNGHMANRHALHSFYFLSYRIRLLSFRRLRL